MKRQFNIRISDECFEQLETLTKRSSTNICPTCGSETEIEFSKYKGMYWGDEADIYYGGDEEVRHQEARDWMEEMEEKYPKAWNLI